MKRAITGIVAAGIALGMMAPAAFAATSSTSSLSAAGGKTITVDGSTLYTGVQAGTLMDNGQATEYFPIYYLIQSLTKAGYVNSYNPKTNTWNIQMPGVNATNVSVAGGVGTGNAAIAINGVVVKKFNAAWHQDFAGGPKAPVTTYFPVYYLGNVLEAAGFSNAWNGAAGTFGFTSQYGQAAGVTLSAASSSVIANSAATDTITATVVDANGHVVRNFNGTASVSVVGSDFALPSPATVTFANGVGTFTVTSNANIAGNTDTLNVYNLQTTNGSPMATNISYGSTTLTTVAPTASKLDISVPSADPTTMSANNQNHTFVTVSAEDASGAVYSNAGQYVTLNLSGPGSFSPSSSVTSTTVWVTGTSVPVEVYSEAGQAGNISVTATATGLAPAALNIPTYINTSASKLDVTSTSGTDSSGKAYTVYTVKLLDTNGNPISGSSDNLSVTDNGVAQGGALTYGSVDASGNFTSGSAPTQLQNGVATFAVENGTVGTNPVTITVTDTSNSNLAAVTAQYDYNAGTATTVDVTPDNTTNNGVAEAGQTVSYSAQLVDGANNAVAKAGQSVEFQFVNDNAGALFGNGTNSGVYYATTDANGVATININVPSNAVLNQSFELEAALASATPSWVTGGSTTVVGASTYATQVQVSGAPTSPVTAGTASIAGISALVENAVGSPLIGDSLQVTSSNDNVVSVGGAGSATETLTAANPTSITGLAAGQAGTATITIQDVSNPNMPKTTFNISVQPGQASMAQLEYQGKAISSSNALTVSANGPVGLTLVNVDNGGDAVPVSTAEANGGTSATFNLSDSNGGAFSLTPGGAPVTSVSIPVGQTSVSVYYVNGTSQTITSGLSATQATGVAASLAQTQAYVAPVAVAQVETISATTPPSAAGTVTVEFKDGTLDQTESVSLGATDSLATVGSKIAAAFSADSTITNAYTVKDNGDGTVSLTQKSPASATFTVVYTDNATPTGAVISGATTTPYSAGTATQQVNTLTVSSGAANAGTLNVTFKDGSINTTVGVAVTANETAASVATAISSALSANASIGAAYTVANPSNGVVTFTTKAAKDNTVSVSIQG